MDLKIFTEGKIDNQSIVFVHGFPFDHLMWQKQIEELKSDFYCVSYDIRGLGKSPAGNGQFTIESFVDDLERLINSLKLKEPILCGLSMGGYISLRAIEKNQNLYKALILCDTKSEADTNEVKINRANGIKKINREGVKLYVDDFIPNCFSKKSINKIEIDYKNIIWRAEKFSPQGVKGCLLAMAGRTDTTGFLNKINIPVLVICGEDDTLAPPGVMKAMSDKIADADFKVVRNAGHLSPVENAEEFNRYLIEFLKAKVKI